MAMGYQGLAQIGSRELTAAGITDGYVNLLINGASINMQLNPIDSQAIWGAGWYNGAETVNYADNVITYEGGLDFELQASKNAWNLIRDWAIESRAYSRACRYTPDGSWIYSYTDASGNYPQDPRDPATYTAAATSRKGLWARGMSISADSGSIVSVSMDCVGLERNVFGPAAPQAFGTNIVDPALQGITDPGAVSYVQDKFGISNPNNPLNPFQGTAPNIYNNVDPIPYWRTEAYIKRFDGTNWERVSVGPVGQLVETETVNWSVDLSNNTVILYTCRGVRGASAVLQGPIGVTGSITLYNPYGVFDPVFGAPGILGYDTPGFDESSPAFTADNTEFVINITGADVQMALPAVRFDSDDYSIQSQSDITNRTFSIKGLGGRLLSEKDSAITYSPTSYVPNHTAPTDVSLPPLIMTQKA